MEASYIGSGDNWPECTVNNHFMGNGFQENSSKNGLNTDSSDSNSTDTMSNDAIAANTNAKSIDHDGNTATVAVLDTTTDINDLKKNLFTEEEFRSVNHSEPIHIFLKLKPLSIMDLSKQNNQLFYKIHSDTTISLIPPKNSFYTQTKDRILTLTKTLFQFSYIFQSTITQQDFFMGTIHPCFEKFFNGDNLLIFSYGVTNSGKVR